MFLIILKSWLIGIIVAAPIGPIGLLCIRKTLELGLKGALIVGLGAATADALYGAFAGLGLAAISNFLLEHTFYFKFFGGFLLMGLGAKEYFSTAPIKNGSTILTKKAAIPIIGTSILLTITNPLTILSFIALFSTIGGIGSFTASEISCMVLGIFLGSMTWWLTLGSIIHHTKTYVPQKIIQGVRQGAALILIVFGGYAVVSAAH